MMLGSPATAVQRWAVVIFERDRLATYQATKDSTFPGRRGFHDVGDRGDLVAMLAPANWRDVTTGRNALGEGVHLFFVPRSEFIALGDTAKVWAESDRMVEALSPGDIAGLRRTFGRAG